MPASLEDQLFLRFCRTGDTAALAEVFDRTAAELLRVAAHVSGDPQAAEDLVQATFLAALESAREWDPARRLLPWLVGILTHRAQTRRRQERRAPDPERVRREAVLDPVAEAQQAETWRELFRAIRELPELYQTPLVLHLRHGLDAWEIAEAMRRPGGTVRAQLSRGMELLRKALPVGIALSFMPIRGLAAARAVVLARAETMAAGVGWGAAGLLVGGVLVMKKTMGVVAGILVVAVSVILAWPVAPGPGDLLEDADLRGAARAPASAPAAVRETAAPAASREVRPDSQSAGSPAGSLRVRARFADGSAAEGVVVVALPADGAFLDPRERSAVAAADGNARLGPLAPGRWLVEGDRGGRTTADVAAVGETRCELEIPRGITVRGHVRDDSRLAIAGARVWVSRSPFDGNVVAQTGHDGAFVLHHVAPERTVSAWAHGFAPSRCHAVLGSPGGAIDVELVLARTGTFLSGTVVDRLGQGIAGARVCVGERLHGRGGTAQPEFPDPNRSRSLWSPPPVLEARTDPGGRFRIAGVAPASESLAAAVSAEGFAPWTGAWQLPKDAPREVTVTLLRGATLRGVARNAEGRPLAAVAVRVLRAGVETVARADTGEDGAFVFEHLPPESLQLGARKRGVGRASTSLAAQDEQEVRWDPVLGVGPYLLGRVTDERGQPLAGWRVGAWAPPWSRPRELFETDASGGFRIPECTEPRYTIQVMDPSVPLLPMQPVASLAGVQPGSELHVLVVEDARRPSAVVTAQIVTGAGTPAAGATVYVRRKTGESMVTEKTDADGRYRSYPLVAGSYDLTVMAADHVEYRQEAIVVEPRATRDLGTIRLEPAGSVLLTVRGADPGKATLLPRLLDGAGIGRHSFEPRDDGTWRARAVPAGRYGVVLWPDGAAAARASVEVPRGGGVARVELELEPGIPCRFTFAGVSDPEATWNIDWKTGSGDWLEQTVCLRFTGTLTRRFAPGTWSVEIRAEDGRAARREFTVSPTDRELDVQVPAPAR